MRAGEHTRRFTTRQLIASRRSRSTTPQNHLWVPPKFISLTLLLSILARFVSRNGYRSSGRHPKRIGGRRTNLTDLLQDAMRPHATTVSCYSVPDICRRKAIVSMFWLALLPLSGSQHLRTRTMKNLRRRERRADLEHASSLRQDSSRRNTRLCRISGPLTPSRESAGKGGVGQAKRMAAAPWK